MNIISLGLLAKKHWKVILPLAFFILSIPIFLPVAIAHMFFPSSKPEQISDYQRVGGATGVDWTEIIIYDTVRYNNDFANADPEESTFEFFNIKYTRYEYQEVGTGEYIEREVTINGVTKTIRVEETTTEKVAVETREGSGYEGIKRLLNSLGYDTRSSNMKITKVLSYFEGLNNNSYYDVEIDRLTIEDLILPFDNKQQNWAYDLLSSIHILYGGSSLEEYYLPDGVSPFMFPTPTIRKITSPFGYRTHPVTGERYKFHAGIDIAELGCHGDPVVAVADGIVAEVVPSNSTAGWYIRLVHNIEGVEWQSRYLHLSAFNVRVGDRVIQGQRIGSIGNTGRSTGAHLHFELKYMGSYVDPLKYLSR